MKPREPNGIKIKDFYGVGAAAEIAAGGDNPQIQYISSSFLSQRWTQEKKEMLNLLNGLKIK